MKFFALFFSIFISNLNAYSIVFIHIGPELPDYLPVAIEQARLFNKECPIYLVGNQNAFKNTQLQVDETVHCIPCETLIPSKSHCLFRSHSKHDRKAFQGFWTFTSERFFYLEELVNQYNLEDVFHLENDVMLYADLNDSLPLFHQYYSEKIGATFDNEARCIPGFVYISNSKPIKELVKFMAGRAVAAKNDMEIFQEFKNTYDQLYIDNLPIVIPEYCWDHVLRNAMGNIAKHPSRFSQNFTAFQSIFDAAAIGQYLGGISPRNGSLAPGFINESCFFDPSLFSYEWKKDREDRLIPFIQYKGAEYPINNLHIHSKKLLFFSSKR
jgi:hypothetical protein